MSSYRPLTPERIKYLVVHCAATRPSMDVGVQEIRRWHLQRGFFDVGYHYVIRRDGSLETGRTADRPGAHVKGHNGHSLGICMVGGVTEDNFAVAEDNFTPAQYAKLEWLLRELSKEYPKAEVVGHHDLDPRKACPSFPAKTWWKERTSAPDFSHVTGGYSSTAPKA